MSIIVLLGYENENGKETTSENSSISSVPPKRQKPSLSETDADWNLLTATQYHKNVYRDFKNLLNLDKSGTYSQEDETNLHYFKMNQQSQNSILFPYIHIVHFSFHLLYEELKLNTVRVKELPLLAKLLCKLAGDLGLKEYVICYWRDFPSDCVVNIDETVIDNDLKKIVRWSVMTEKPYFLMEYLCSMLSDVNVAPFPYIPHVNSRTRDIVQVRKTFLL